MKIYKEIFSLSIIFLLSGSTQLSCMEEGISSEPDDILILYSPNVSVQNIIIIEKDGTLRHGVPRSDACTVWDIPIRRAGGSFFVKIELPNKKYGFKIEKFGKDGELYLVIDIKKGKPRLVFKHS